MPSGAASGTIASITLYDAGNESSTFQCWGADLDAAGFDAAESLWATLVTKVTALKLGAIGRTRYGNDIIYDWTQPTNGAAREIALVVQYKDSTTGQRLTCRIPTLDPTIPDYVVNVNAKDVVLLTSPTAITEFITAFNAFAINPYTGNACEVIGLKVARGGK